MSRVRVHNFSISLDGFGVGESQSLEAPFGHAGERLLRWALPTRTFQRMGFHGREESTVGVDDAFASNWAEDIGVEIMGRNKFAPSRGPWENEEWRGWWGDDPPFHTPVMVLTHYPRLPLEMEGGTTFYFVNADPPEALRRARGLGSNGDGLSAKPPGSLWRWGAVRCLPCRGARRWWSAGPGGGRRCVGPYGSPRRRAAGRGGPGRG